MNFVFLHGFLSSPQSSKIAIISERLQEDPDIDVTSTHAVDLYPTKEDFESLSFTALLDDVVEYIQDLDQVILIGSSHGGLLALWVAGKHPNLVDGLILLAPAIYYHEILVKRYNIDEWQRRGYILQDHPRYKGKSRLPITYFRTLDQFREPDFNLKMPTLLIHGQMDRVVPVDYSYYFIEQQNSDIDFFYPPIGNHRLSNVIDEVTETILQWVKDQH